MKAGLVLSGGGARGAFEIGVWKALREYGVESSIRMVSGTSVGALNAALFVQGDLQAAERLWTNITPEMVTGFGREQIQSILGFLSRNLHVALPAAFLNWLDSFRAGIFRQEALERLIRDHLDFSAIRRGIPCHVTATQLSGLRSTHFRLNDFDPEIMVRILLASAAVPLLWKSVEIDGSIYVDGGFSRQLLTPGAIEDTSNTPVLPAVFEGCDVIYTVFLNRADIVGHGRFPDVHLIPVVPPESMGGVLAGMLDFRSETARRNMEMGYRCMVAILEPAARTAGLDALGQGFLRETLRLQAENARRLERLDTSEPRGRDGSRNEEK